MMVYVRMYNTPDGDSRIGTARPPDADLSHSAFGALMEVVGAEVIIWVLNRQKLAKSGLGNVIVTIVLLLLSIGVALAMNKLSPIIVSTVVWQFIFGWSGHEKQHGKLVKIKGFPGSHKVKLFQVVLSTGRMEHVVTNDMAQEVHGFLWKVKQFHSETKQLAGLEGC
jgi:hypothetical protein